MKIYLAGFKTIEKRWTKSTKDIFLLSSFWEHKSGRYGDYVYQKKHILDSGAFSAIVNPLQAKNYDWDNYVEKYINFIKKTNQQYFFELDIDVVVGLDHVHQFRDRVEQAVGRPCIPVWHRSRGLDSWHDLTERYSYVAIGGFAIKHIKQVEYKFIPKFLKIAEKNSCRVHGLGFTSFRFLRRFNFYSVDSTTWLGAQYGRLFIYDWHTNQIRDNRRPSGKRLKNSTNTHLHNFQQWVYYQRYALENL